MFLSLALGVAIVFWPHMDSDQTILLMVAAFVSAMVAGAVMQVTHWAQSQWEIVLTGQYNARRRKVSRWEYRAWRRAANVLPIIGGCLQFTAVACIAVWVSDLLSWEWSWLGEVPVGSFLGRMILGVISVGILLPFIYAGNLISFGWDVRNALEVVKGSVWVTGIMVVTTVTIVFTVLYNYIV